MTGQPGTTNSILDVTGLSVGHAEDRRLGSGVSVVIAGTYLDDSNHAGLNSREHVNTTDVAVYRSASVRDVVDVFEQCLDWVESLE